MKTYTPKSNSWLRHCAVYMWIHSPGVSVCCHGGKIKTHWRRFEFLSYPVPLFLFQFRPKCNRLICSWRILSKVAKQKIHSARDRKQDRQRKNVMSPVKRGPLRHKTKSFFCRRSYVYLHHNVNNTKFSYRWQQLSLTNRAMLVCKVVEVWQDFLSEYVDKKFTYI